jgi:hypothetical protein
MKSRLPRRSGLGLRKRLTLHRGATCWHGLSPGPATPLQLLVKVDSPVPPSSNTRCQWQMTPSSSVTLSAARTGTNSDRTESSGLAPVPVRPVHLDPVHPAAGRSRRRAQRRLGRRRLRQRSGRNRYRAVQDRADQPAQPMAHPRPGRSAPSNGSTGSTTADRTPPAQTSSQPSSSRSTTVNTQPSPRRWSQHHERPDTRDDSRAPWRSPSRASRRRADSGLHAPFRVLAGDSYPFRSERGSAPYPC